jgi:hypothetical protein
MSEESRHGQSAGQSQSQRAIGSLTDESCNDGFGPDFVAIVLSRPPETWYNLPMILSIQGRIDGIRRELREAS